ncbi:MerR family DNA-binding transcriptional regulator [Actinoplanes sp. NBRC 103695]|uniref:MerR family DNA-binding transcriptional regulator n=1 Tax=Actinoplanes sp. NBRC 103695 TaxID=3032202 RepID=UPI002555C020|nr:MerR family DNA-binding transcriptional regulator [Actinoplanes sp. NBRC 103695]
MPATITIGEFSRLTHLPVKTLHRYHEVGVLVPGGGPDPRGLSGDTRRHGRFVPVAYRGLLADQGS